MKKSVLLSIISLVVVIQLSAQTEQGTLLLGGSLGFSSSTSETSSGGTTVDGPKYGDFSIMPIGGYFLADELAVGLGIGFTSNSVSTTEGDFDLTDKATLFEIMPFARYYYVTGDMVMLYAQLALAFGFGSYQDEFVTIDEDFNEIVATSEMDISTMNVGVGPGATIMLGEKCGLDVHYGSLGFSSTTTTDADADTEYKSSSFGLSWAETFAFGIVFHI